MMPAGFSTSPCLSRWTMVVSDMARPAYLVSLRPGSRSGRTAGTRFRTSRAAPPGAVRPRATANVALITARRGSRWFRAPPRSGRQPGPAAAAPRRPPHRMNVCGFQRGRVMHGHRKPRRCAPHRAGRRYQQVNWPIGEGASGESIQPAQIRGRQASRHSSRSRPQDGRPQPLLVRQRP
jgi:hypothetical protein